MHPWVLTSHPLGRSEFSKGQACKCYIIVPLGDNLFTSHKIKHSQPGGGGGQNLIEIVSVQGIMPLGMFRSIRNKEFSYRCNQNGLIRPKKNQTIPIFIESYLNLDKNILVEIWPNAKCLVQDRLLKSNCNFVAENTNLRKKRNGT